MFEFQWPEFSQECSDLLWRNQQTIVIEVILLVFLVFSKIPILNFIQYEVVSIRNS